MDRHDPAEVALPEADHALLLHRAILDAMPDRIAVLDARGVIIAANTAWRVTRADLGALGRPVDPVGLDYYDQCTEAAVGPQGGHAKVVRDGIERVLAGEDAAFGHEYPCKSGRENCWYRVDVIPMRGGAARVLVRHQDITDSRLAEEQRRASDALFRLSVDESTDAVMVHEPLGTVVDLNKAACKHLGYSREELIGRAPSFFDKRTDRPVEAELDRQLVLGAPCIFETEHTRKDGRAVPVEVRMRSFSVEGRRYHISITHDISERKRAEAALREALERLEKMAARLPGFVYQYRRNRDGTFAFAYASEGIREMFRITPEEAYADAWRVFNVVHPDDRAALEATARSSMHDLKPWLLDMRLRYDDGTERWAAGNAMPERLPDGSTVWHGFVTDITERRRAEVDLRIMGAALRSISQGVVISDTQSKVLTINPAFAAMTGFTPGEVVGKTCATLLAGQPAEVLEALKEAHAAGRVFEREIYDARRDGTHYWNDLTVSPVRDDAGNVTHFVGVSRDITERKLAEAELAQHRDKLEALVRSRTAELAAARDAAEAASRAKSTFLANMSHELRTPMSGIMGMTDLALREATSPRQIDYLTKSAQASRHLLAIINDILDLSRIEADRLVLDPQDFDIRQLVESTLRMQEAAARAKRLRLTSVIAPSLPGRLHADPLRLRQVLLNYVSNAIKFSERGEIVVRAHATPQEDGGLLLRIEVQDEGIGIAPEQQSQLFRPFMQADQSTTRLYGGTGLGLAISHRLAHLLGGEAGCRSTPGQGSVFWMTARVEPATGDASSATDGEAPELRLLRRHAGARILLADDQPVTQEVVRLLLQAAGLSADVVGSGDAAVERAARGDYALVLMDVHMPGMDGLDATRAIRRLPQCADLPIVAMTAAVFDEDRERCRAAGMDGHLAKPVSPEALWRVLVEFLERDETAPGARGVPDARGA